MAIRLHQALRLVIASALAWLVFGNLGIFAAEALARIRFSDTWGWMLYAFGLSLSVACAAAALKIARSSRSLSNNVAFLLGGLATFFPVPLCTLGTPDWNPIPLLAAAATCLACGCIVAVLWWREPYSPQWMWRTW